MEDSYTEGDLNYGNLAQEVSEEKHFCLMMRYHSYDILLKNLAGFWPYLKSLPEAIASVKRLIALRKEISKLPSIDSVLWFTLMKSVLIKYSRLRKEKVQNVWFKD